MKKRLEAKNASLATFKIKPTLDGLSIEETIEFQMLDALAALDVNGKQPRRLRATLTPREKRWLELYERQVRARTGMRRTRFHKQ
jgi:hypothetical protein